MRRELEVALDLAKTLPAGELPRLIGDLAEVAAAATARLLSPAIAPPDANLEVKAAALRLGVSPAFLYRNSKKFPFTRRIGRKLLFSSEGLSSYLKQKQRS